MATIYRKTDKGQTEIETRLYRLAPRLRTALILVDGRRAEDELAKLIPGDPVASLAALLGEGFIEALAQAEVRAPPRPPSAARASTASPPQAPRSFETHRREAIKALTDQVGPTAEAVAMRMEKCANWNQLLPMLQMAQQILRSSRGPTTAAEFARRFIESPPG